MTRQQVPNVELARDTARSNLLTNGGFEIWQRGNGPFTTGGAFTADRWLLWGSVTVTRDTATTNGSPTSAKCVATSGGCYFGQPLEYAQLSLRILTLTVDVWANASNAVRLNMQPNGNVNNFSAYHPGTSTWQRLSVTMPATALTSGLIAYIQFDAAATAYFDNATLAVGSVAADYAPLHPADDLARCERYYEVPGADGVGSLIVWGLATGSNTARGAYRFRSKKAVTPTATKVGTWTLQNATVQPTVSVTGVDGFYLFLTSTGAGDFYAVNDAATKYLTFEANP